MGVRCWAACVALLAACAKPATPPQTQRPTILLITLDTTRADAIGPDTPGYNAIARRGMVFRQAYATVPQTLASHASMLTGLYAAGHGLHENGRYLDQRVPLVGERLHAAGYRTAAFVSSFALARQFGLARGFDVYDDAMPQGHVERSANDTTDRALAYLAQSSDEPLFVWVHYYEPHYPYEPPEPFRTRYASKPYLGEVAAMDQQLDRFVREAAQRVKAPLAIIIAGDHGEGLGEHGEAFHGNLLYQSTMHVPLAVIAPGVSPGVSDAPVSTRHIFDTILDVAGIDSANSLRRAHAEVVAGEAMNPFLAYGWQPQVMAVDGRQKAIFSGKLEVYDVIADPKELHDLGANANVSRGIRTTLAGYPLPSLTTPAAATDEDKRKLASLGYITSDVKPVVRKDAPRPADMTALFDPLEHANALFIQQRYADVAPLLQDIAKKDPNNLEVALHLATSYSQLGRDREAMAEFERAARIAPGSADVRTLLALHYVRGKDWERAIPLVEGVLKESPDRLLALEALAVIRERQGRFDDALEVRRKIYAMRPPSPPELLHLAQLETSANQPAAAIVTLEKLRAIMGPRFAYDVQLGMLYQMTGQLQQAREAFDRVPPNHPAFAMALYKRAQISVMLHEPDEAQRIDAARQHADATTQQLIARDPMFAR